MSDGSKIDVGDIIAPVLQLVPGTGGETNRVKGLGYGLCGHKRTQLDADKRAVTCRDCGKTLDPFDVLMEYARAERVWQQWDRDTDELRREVARLKEEERKVKARTQSASRKDAAVAVEAERARTERARQDTIELARDVAGLARRIEALQTRGARKDPRTPEERNHGRA